MRRVANAFKNRILIAMLLVFSTLVSISSYATALETAVALEQQPRCGMPEHIHSEECYSGDILICGQKTHFHGENCYILSLEDNDINGLLSLMDSEEDKSLESMLNKAISDGAANSDIVLKENLSTSLTSDGGGAGTGALLATVPSLPNTEELQQDTLNVPAPEAQEPQQDALSSPTPEPEVPQQSMLSSPIPEPEVPQQNTPSAPTPETDSTLMPVEGNAPNTVPAYIEMVPYLEANGGNYFITLLDINNHELPKGTNGHYTAKADTTYKLTISFTSPGSFENSTQGIYHYQLPNGFQIDTEESCTGTFVLKDSTNVGSWVMTDDRMVTLEFNENIDNQTDITVSFTLKIIFQEESELVDFDGKITVAVEKKPLQTVTHTEINKWGIQGDPENALDPNHSHKTDPNKIYWTVHITGNRASHIVGSVLSDRVLMNDWSYSHSYTEADIAGGLSIGASIVNPETGQETDWHRWTVLPGDPNLTNWDADSWSYTMPEKIICEMCGNEITLGDEYWGYYVEYTSTPHTANIAGELGYSNMAGIDGQEKEGWAGFTHAEIAVAAFKTGTFVSDASGGRFQWEIKVSIPGRKQGDTAIVEWTLCDEMHILDANYNHLGNPSNDFSSTTITANYRGKTITVPRIQDATEDDPYAWRYGWHDAYSNSYTMYLLHRCNCTTETCGHADHNCWTWDYTRDDGVYVPTSDYCSCWTETEDTTLTFTYHTDAAKIIADHGGNGNQVQNRITLNHQKQWAAAQAATTVAIPSVLEKTIPPQDDSDIVHYNITLNESRLVLTDGSPLAIHDVMTDTMTYISGSLVVKAVDAAGNETALKQGTDFTVTYDGSGNQKDDQNNPAHVLDIVILHPQPLMYLLDYDTTFIIPDQVSEGIRYSNYATIKLWGETITSSVPERVHANINISANNYKLELHKTAADSGYDLQGASFGLYNESGGLITTASTNTYGLLTFQTYVPQGVIIRDHVLYYVQEIKAPSGYRLDTTKHWFYFCDETEGPCQRCEENWAGPDVKRFPYNVNGNTVAKLDIENELMRVELPSTGGTGTALFNVGGGALIAAAMLILYLKLRRKEDDANA